jgi:hypothetical protein
MDRYRDCGIHVPLYCECAISSLHVPVVVVVIHSSADARSTELIIEILA